MRTSTAVFAIALLAVVADDADARRRRSFGGGGYSSNGKFGLGLELGAPTGFNGKYFLSPDRALNFGIGWYYDGYYNDRDGGHLYLDYMFHPAVLTRNATFQMPFFIGVGGRIWDFDDFDRDRDGDRDGFAFGVRSPIGLAFDFNNVPLDIFLALTIGVDFLYDYRDDLGFNVGFSFGIRYWFD